MLQVSDSTFSRRKEYEKSMFNNCSLILLCDDFCPGGDNMKAFPPAEKGMVRYVLQLPDRMTNRSFKGGADRRENRLVDEVNKSFSAARSRWRTIKAGDFHV